MNSIKYDLCRKPYMLNEMDKKDIQEAVKASNNPNRKLKGRADSETITIVDDYIEEVRLEIVCSKLEILRQMTTDELKCFIAEVFESNKPHIEG